MKSVLVLASTFPRYQGDATPSFVFDLCKKLGRSYRMAVLAPHDPAAKKFERMENLDVYRFRYFMPESLQKLAYGGGMLPNIKSSHLAKLQVPSFFFSQLNSAVKLAKELRPNIIHAHWIIPQGIIGAFLKRQLGIPLIVTVHGTDLFPLKNPLLKKLQRYVLKNADAITVNSSLAKEEIQRRFGISNVNIIPMGIDTKKFRRKDTKGKFKKYKGKKIILFVGRLNEQKGADCLIRSMPLVLQKNGNARLIIIGEGEYGNYLKKLVDGMSLNHHVEFVGAKSHNELPSYYSMADVFVLPSSTSKIGTESFGLVIVEAMACKACVIGSSSGAIKEIIKDNSNGLVFEEKNHFELAGKINLVLSDKKLREKLAKSGYDFARKNFSWDMIAGKFERIYREVAK